MLKLSAHGPILYQPQPIPRPHPHPHRPVAAYPGVEQDPHMMRTIHRPAPSKRRQHSTEMTIPEPTSTHSAINGTRVSTFLSNRQPKQELLTRLASTSQHHHDQTYRDLTLPSSSGLSNPSEIPLTSMCTSEYNPVYHTSPPQPGNMGLPPPSTSGYSAVSATTDLTTSSYSAQMQDGRPNYLNAVDIQRQPSTSANDRYTDLIRDEPPSIYSGLHTVQQSHGVSEPSVTTTYNNPNVSLSDIEPVVSELITSLAADDLPNLPPSTTGCMESLPLVGYVPSSTVVGTTESTEYALQSSVGYTPPASFYCQTAYDCHDCTPSTSDPSSTIQASSTYLSTQQPQQQSQQNSGSTRRLQHLPVELDLPAEYPHPNGTQGQLYSQPQGPVLQYSPPQGTVSQGQMYSPPQGAITQGQMYSPPQASCNSNSPSSYYPSPPSSNELHQPISRHRHADPPSLTPSPENRDLKQHMTTESYVEGLFQHQDYSHHIPQHHFMPPNLESSV